MQPHFLFGKHTKGGGCDFVCPEAEFKIHTRLILGRFWDPAQLPEGSVLADPEEVPPGDGEGPVVHIAQVCGV